jgi:hypothetical protein
MVWNIAICVAGFTNNRCKTSTLNDFHIKSIMANTTEPITLNNRCMTLARLAFTVVPIDEISAVTQEPMFEPRMIYNTAFPPPPIFLWLWTTPCPRWTA